MERIDKQGGETFVNEITEQVVRVVTGGFQSYFYIGHICTNGLDLGKKSIKPVPVILNSKIGKRISPSELVIKQSACP